MITEKHIRSRYNEITNECIDKLSIERWVIMPTCFSLSSRKVLGTAKSTGEISVSRAYLGSVDYDGLDDTIRHELAHLAAGLQAKHGVEWKRMAVLFGATPTSRGMTTQCVQDSLYKYYIMAHMADGTILPIKPANRKVRKYTDYVWGCSIRNVDIKRFQYVSYKRGKQLASQ